MALGIRNLSLPTRVLLLILVPIIFQAICFAKLMSELDGLETTLIEEYQAMEVLLDTSEIANDLVTAAVSGSLSQHWKDKSFLAESTLLVIGIEDKMAKLKRKKHTNKELQVSVDIFEEAMNSINSSIEQAQKDPESLNAAKFIDFTRTMIQRLGRDKDRMLAVHDTFRKETQRKQQEERDNIRNLLIFITGSNIVVAGLVAVVFSLTLARKFRRIMVDIYDFSAGKPLVQPLTGDDDVSRIDQVLHQLSSELELARKRERALLDNSAEVICSLDGGLRIMEINPAVERRLGYDPSEVLYANLQSYVHPDDRDSTFAFLEQCKAGEAETTFECRLRKNNGRYIDSEWTSTWSSEERSFSCVIRDISERKEAEKLKQEVIAMVSHDLRSPLTSIGLLLDMMVEGAAGELNERGKRLTEHAQGSVSSLIRMINDLLDVERYESGSLVLEYSKILAEDVLASAVQTITPEAEHKKITVICKSEDLRVELDADRINRVLVNLLGNAVKFAPQGSVIQVNCTLIKRENKPPQAGFSVKDQGPGIPADKLDAVFEKFRQADRGLEGEKKGSGLGLAICRAIIEAHHGTIGVTSTEGDGSNFWFHVPLDAPHASSSPGDQATQSRSDNRIRL